MDEDSRTLWCGNLSDKVTEELLYELFLQTAPIERVRVLSDRSGRKSNFGFVTVKHEASVNYVVQVLDGTTLYDRIIIVKRKNHNRNQQLAKPNIVNFDQLILMGQLLQVNSLQPQMQLADFSNDRRGNRSDNDRYRPYRNRNNYDDRSNRPQWNNHRNDGNSHHHGRGHGHGHDKDKRNRYKQNKY